MNIGNIRENFIGKLKEVHVGSDIDVFIDFLKQNPKKNQYILYKHENKIKLSTATTFSHLSHEPDCYGYLNLEEAALVMAYLNIELINTAVLPAKIATIASAFGLVLPGISYLMTNSTAITLGTPAIPVFSVVAIYCTLIYPMIYSLLSYWWPEKFPQFDILALVKEGVKTFIPIGMGMLGLGIAGVEGFSPTTTAFLTGGAMFTGELLNELIFSPLETLKQWGSNCEKIISMNWSIDGLIKFLKEVFLPLGLNSLLVFVFGQLQPIFSGWAQTIGYDPGLLTGLFNASYVATYISTLPQFFSHCLGAIQTAYSFKDLEKKNEYGLGFFEQCFPSSLQSCFVQSMTTVGKCFSYCGKMLPNCTSIAANDDDPLIQVQPS